jgi:hypothetical protein
LIDARIEYWVVGAGIKMVILGLPLLEHIKHLTQIDNNQGCKAFVFENGPDVSSSGEK